MHSDPHPSHHAIAPLHALLTSSLQLPPEYRDQLTNHLPMALHALHNLGATPQRMQDFYAHYARRFQDLPLAQDAPATGSVPADWHALRGQADAYPALRVYFQDQLARTGVDATLRMALPALMPGVAAAAFHGAIRTAHAVESGHHCELAAALAYWAWRWQALRPPAPDAAPRPLQAWATSLVQTSIGWHSDGPLISIRMEDASHSPVYETLAGALAPAANLAQRIQEMAALAVERYVASPNFTVLHMITGLRALRTLLPWLPDSAALQDTVVHNVVAAYLAARVVPLNEPITAPLRTWSDVIAAAIASNDDHVIKLVHACQEEAAAYGEGHYLRAATLVTRAL